MYSEKVQGVDDLSLHVGGVVVFTMGSNYYVLIPIGGGGEE